jgi:hypothetical protein
MTKQIFRILENLKPGALLSVSWCDASIGKSRTNHGIIDVPVQSFGVFVGLIGAKIKHVVLAQNCFQYSDGLYDLDYTAIPLGWAIGIKVIDAEHIPKEVADNLVASFMVTTTAGAEVKRSISPRTFLNRQKRLSTHGRNL